MEEYVVEENGMDCHKHKKIRFNKNYKKSLVFPLPIKIVPDEAYLNENGNKEEKENGNDIWPTFTYKELDYILLALMRKN